MDLETGGRREEGGRTATIFRLKVNQQPGRATESYTENTVGHHA